MLGLALANVLVYYFVGVHKRRFVWGLAVGAIAFTVLLSSYHSTLGQFTVSVRRHRPDGGGAAGDLRSGSVAPRARLPRHPSDD